MQNFIPILKFIFDFMAYASLGLFLFAVIKTEQEKRDVSRSLEKREISKDEIKETIGILTKAIDGLKEDEKR